MDVALGRFDRYNPRHFLERMNLEITDRPIHVDGISDSYEVNVALTDDVKFQGSMSFFIREDQIVQLISFGAGDLRQAPYYTVRNIMKDLGVPTYIGVDLSIGDPTGLPSAASITILIAYEENKQTTDLERPWALFYYFSEPPDIESATGVSVQEVYNRMMEKLGQVCFDTPIDFWPQVKLDQQTK